MQQAASGELCLLQEGVRYCRAPFASYVWETAERVGDEVQQGWSRCASTHALLSLLGVDLVVVVCLEGEGGHGSWHQEHVKDRELNIVLQADGDQPCHVVMQPIARSATSSACLRPIITKKQNHDTLHAQLSMMQMITA